MKDYIKKYPNIDGDGVPLSSDFCDWMVLIHGKVTDIGGVPIVTERVLSAKNVTSYRNVNHWSESGIIPDARAADSQDWRKYTLAEFLWVAAVAKLREFGVPLDSLKTAYSMIWEKGSIVMDAVVASCLTKVPVFLVLQSGGKAYATDQEGLWRLDGNLVYGDTLRINFNDIFQAQIEGADAYEPIYRLALTVSKPEYKVITALRKTGVESVSIKKTGKGNSRIEVVEIADKSKSAKQLVDDISYGEISIKVEKGQQAIRRITRKFNDDDDD